MMTEQVTKMSMPKAEFVNATVVRESAEEVLGNSSGTVKKLVAALVSKFAGTKDVATCDKCDGVSPAKLSRCPFCGDADAEEIAAEIEKSGKKATARKEKAEISSVTAGDYKKNFKELEACKESICTDFWRLGELCLWFQANRAWLAVRDDAGRSKYKSFDTWVVEEAGFSKTYVYGVMGLVKSFTQEQVKKYGKTHMLALTSSDEVDRPFLLKQLEEKPDMHPGELQKLVVQAKAARKTTKLKPKGEPAHRVTVEQTPVEPKSITTIFPVGRTEVEMFARIQANEPMKVATDIVEQPWGKMTLENGVDVFFGLARRADGQFILTVQATRND